MGKASVTRNLPRARPAVLPSLPSIPGIHRETGHGVSCHRLRLSGNGCGMLFFFDHISKAKTRQHNTLTTDLQNTPNEYRAEGVMGRWDVQKGKQKPTSLRHWYQTLTCSMLATVSPRKNTTEYDCPRALPGLKNEEEEARRPRSQSQLCHVIQVDRQCISQSAYPSLKTTGTPGHGNIYNLLSCPKLGQSNPLS